MAPTNDDDHDDYDAHRIILHGDILLRGENAIAETIISMVQFSNAGRYDYHQFNMQTLAILPTLLENVKNYVTLTVRDVYYCFQFYFYSYNGCASFIRCLCNKMDLQMIHLSVVPNITIGAWMFASKGFKTIYNDVEVLHWFPDNTWGGRAFHLPDAQSAFFNRPRLDPEQDDTNSEQDDTDSEQDGTDTQTEVAQEANCTLDFECEFADGSTEPEFLFISEKGNWIERMKKKGILRKRNVIMINTFGYPSYNVLSLVKMLHTKYPSMRIVGLFDCAPSGFDIMQKFYFARTYGYMFSVPIVHAGLLPSEAMKDDDIFSRMKNSGKPFDLPKRQGDVRIRNNPWMWHSSAGDREKSVKEMDLMRDYNSGEGWSCNMNHFRPRSGSIADYVLDIMDNKKYLAGPAVAGHDSI